MFAAAKLSKYACSKNVKRQPALNASPILYRFGVIAPYYSNYGHFAILSHLLGSLGTTYDVHRGLIRKLVVDFLLVLIELFSLGRTAEALRAIIGSKSAISLQRCLLYTSPSPRD